MKINERGPLPDHTKLNYQECYAKLLLEKYIGKFKNGLILQDKPDLFSKDLNIGIEVTDIMSKDKKEAIKLWYTMPYVSKEKQILHKKRMEKLGYPYKEVVMEWPPIDYSNGLESEHFIGLYEALRKKLIKLNKGLYNSAQRIECLFFTELWMWRNEYIALGKKLIDIQSMFIVKFNTIYVVDTEYIYIYDFESNKGRRYFYYDKQHEIAIKAREMVVSAENEDF